MGSNEALRHARQERGWSQAVVAAHLDTSVKVVSRWERGSARPSLYFRTKLCELFGADAQALGLLDPPVSSAPPLVEDISTRPRPPIFDPLVASRPFSTAHIVGRDGLLQRVLTALCSQQVCALHGLPGVGKTTLAQVVVRHETIKAHFPDGVLWVGVGPSLEIMSALGRWAKLLGISEEILQRVATAEELQSLLRQALEPRQVLLIIDDAWTTEDAHPFFLGGPGCAHLLTTRFPQVALLVTDEPPIPVTELDEETTTRLFMTLVPMLAEGEAWPLQDLFRVTGGLPLAVTLIGKYLRLHAYSGQPRRLQAALASLSDTQTRLHLALPTGTLKREEEASSSLQRIIAISDEYLPPLAQEALRALSVLPAKPERFSEAAALFVCQQDASVLDQLSDAGLLETAGPGWYWMHQTIADYGQVCMKAEHQSETLPQKRLVDYALQFMTSHARDASALDPEHRTLLAALDATDRYRWQPEQLALTKKLSHYWALHGYAALAQERFRRALRLAEEANDTLGVGWMHFCLGALAETYGAPQAQQHLEEALALLDPLTAAHAPLLKSVLNSLGIIASKQGRLAYAEDCYQQSLALARVQEGPFDVCTVLLNLGGLAARRGQLTTAKQTLHEGLEVLRGRDKAMQGAFLCTLGEVYSLLHDGQDEAQSNYQQALELSEQEHLPAVYCEACLGLGIVAQSQRHWEEARSWFQKAVQSAREQEFQELYVRVLLSLATLALDEHLYDQAEQVLNEAMAEAQAREHIFLLCRCHVVRGNLFLHLHRTIEAQTSFETAQHLLSFEYVLQQLDIQEGLTRLAAAQNDWQKVADLGTALRDQLVSMQHWKKVTFTRWLMLAQEEQMREKLAQEEQAPGDRQQGHEMPVCPHCHDRSAVRKRGKSRAGVQRYHCSHCQKDFTPSSRKTNVPSDQHQEQARILERQGRSLRAIAREIGVHHETVRRWLTPSTKPLM